VAFCPYSRPGSQNGRNEPSGVTFAHIWRQTPKMLQMSVLEPLLPISAARRPKPRNSSPLRPLGSRKLEKTEKTRENRETRPHRGHLPREHRENSRLLKNTEKTRARRGHLSRDNLRKPRILFKETVRVNWLGFTGLCFTSLCSLHSDMYMSGSH
jgi:hypothetical protein